MNVAPQHPAGRLQFADPANRAHLSRLAKSGRAVRVASGIYIVDGSLPPEALARYHSEVASGESVGEGSCRGEVHGSVLAIRTGRTDYLGEGVLISRVLFRCLWPWSRRPVVMASRARDSGAPRRCSGLRASRRCRIRPRLLSARASPKRSRRSRKMVAVRW